MNNATRKTRIEHDRAIAAADRRKTNLARKRQRLLAQGRTRQMRKPRNIQQVEWVFPIACTPVLATR